LRGRRILPIIAACSVLLASACGARLTREQVAAATARGAGGEAAAADPAAGDAGSTTTATAAPGAAAGPTGPAPAAGAAPGAAGAGCPPGGKGDVGVSANELKIGTVTTLSGPIPGFGQTALNGVKAYINYANSQGGVCGRKLTLVSADDRLDAGTNRSATQQLVGQVFALVGNLSVVDDGGASVLKGTNVPDVGLAITDARIALPNNFSPNPIDLASGGNGTTRMMQYFAKTYGVRSAAVVFPDQAAARGRAQAYEKDMAAAGISSKEFQVAITETNYAPTASQIKANQLDMVITTLEVNGMARLAQALDQQGYKPKVPFYGAQAYSKKFLQIAGAAAEGTIIGTAYDIPEDGGANPAMATFSQWYQRTNPGADVDFFAIESWAATAMFVDAVRKSGGEVTRAKVLATLQATTATDAGGVLAPNIDPAGKKPSPCFLVVGVKGGKWQRLYPAKGFQC
jgi:ABC-type branched-subunit amino acid transport system substrate-binding protein